MGEVIPFPAPQSAEPPARGSRAEPRPESGTGSRVEPQSHSGAAPQSGSRAASGAEPLWRAVVGEQLRAARADRGERIADVAERAGMSPQYLSEIERGRKDPSSEMLAAVAGALGLTVHELVSRVATRYDVIAVTQSARSRPSPLMAPPPARPTEPLCLAA